MNCSVCRFWELETQFCKRFPPQVFGGTRVVLGSFFPITDAAEWCGEFKPALQSPENQQEPDAGAQGGQS